MTKKIKTIETYDFSEEKKCKSEKDLIQSFQQETKKMENSENDMPQFAGHAGVSLSSSETKRTTEKYIINALKTVEDPDLNIDVYNLGLIYKIIIEKNGDINIDMTLTSPTCPYAEQLFQASAVAVSDLNFTGKVSIKAVWIPTWGLHRLSEEAKYDLDLL